MEGLLALEWKGRRLQNGRAAGSRMEGLLAGTILTEGGLVPALTPGKLRAVNRDILQAAGD